MTPTGGTMSHRTVVYRYAVHGDLPEAATAELGRAHQLHIRLVEIERAYGEQVAAVWAAHPQLAAADQRVQECSTRVEEVARVAAAERTRTGRRRVAATPAQRLSNLRPCRSRSEFRSDQPRRTSDAAADYPVRRVAEFLTHPAGVDRHGRFPCRPSCPPPPGSSGDGYGGGSGPGAPEVVGSRRNARQAQSQPTAASMDRTPRQRPIRRRSDHLNCDCRTSVATAATTSEPPKNHGNQENKALDSPPWSRAWSSSSLR